MQSDNRQPKALFIHLQEPLPSYPPAYPPPMAYYHPPATSSPQHMMAHTVAQIQRNAAIISHLRARQAESVNLMKNLNTQTQTEKPKPFSFSIDSIIGSQSQEEKKLPSSHYNLPPTPDSSEDFSDSEDLDVEC